MRVPASIVGALAVALGLFVLMQRLVAPRVPAPGLPASAPALELLRPPPAPTLRIKERRRPPPPPPAPQRPPPPRAASDALTPPELPVLTLAPPRLPVDAGGAGGPVFGAAYATGGPIGGDVIPLVRIAPRYPREARLRGIEGWVRVRFTIEADGSVSSPAVVEASPPRVFDREALRAVASWKFKPRIVDGVALERDAEQVIEFTMGEE